MENYYKILEVDKEASDEIIEKAYKTLVKKYHPDLKKGNEKIIAENKIKKINEAYDILSDKNKREEYNKNLNENYISVEKYNLIINENLNLKRQLKNYNYSSQQAHKESQSIPKDSKEILKTILSLFLTFLIIFLILQLPFLKNIFEDLFNGNLIFLLLIIIIFCYYFFKNKK